MLEVPIFSNPRLNFLNLNNLRLPIARDKSTIVLFVTPLALERSIFCNRRFVCHALGAGKFHLLQPSQTLFVNEGCHRGYA